VLYLNKSNGNSVTVSYTKSGENILTDHEIAVEENTGKNYLYSVNMQVKKRLIY
jgi:hypothetical protein